MSTDIHIWKFCADRLRDGTGVVLLLVAASRGSSPGRAGYKMAVSADGAMVGSIGGGIMEMNLVNSARDLALSEARPSATRLIDQEHRRNSENASGMICSGSQTVLMRKLRESDLTSIAEFKRGGNLRISQNEFEVDGAEAPNDSRPPVFERRGENDFVYTEHIGTRDRIHIIGGGHCSLALSELMSKLGFAVHIFDDRTELNTIEKNRFADNVTILDDYSNIAPVLDAGPRDYVVVMTLGYATDAVVVRGLLGIDLRYFGVLGSKAKVTTLFRKLREEGVPDSVLRTIHAPIGLPINSRTPYEIAVSIAAEIISIRNETSDDANV